MSSINQDIKEELVELDIVHESKWEQKLLLNNGALLKEEPEDGADTVSWGNVYDSYFEVVKQELCSNDSRIEHLKNHHVDTPAAMLHLCLERQSMFTHIKRESPQDKSSWSTDCAQTLDASFTKVPTKNDVKSKPVTLEICFDAKPQETLIKTADTDGGSPHKTSCLYLTAHTSNIHRHIADNPGEKTYACKNCSFKCSRARDLNKHVMIHTGEKPYACKFCDYKCSQSSHLKIHMINHMGEMPYVCKYCDYNSSEVSNFKSHMLTHSGDKPYACKDCDYKCSTITRLRLHGMRHSGEKPFACNLCNFKSAVAGNLKRHRMRHTGEKPYICKNCGYKTSRPGILKTHMMKHT